MDGGGRTQQLMGLVKLIINIQASSAQSLCVFCACRLTGEVPLALQPTFSFTTARRHLSTTRPSNQSTSSAPAPNQPPTDSQSSGNHPQNGFVIDPNSSLTPSEQREKARLRQLREAAEKQQREAQEARAKLEADRRNAERENQRRIRGQWNQQHSGHQARGQQTREGQRRINDRPQGSQIGGRGNVRDARQRRTSTGSERNGQRQGQGQGQRPQQGQGQPRRQEQQQQQSQRPQIRAPNPFVSSSDARAERVSAPLFGGGAASAETDEVATESGWGTGVTKRAPLQYGTEAPPPPQDSQKSEHLEQVGEEASLEGGSSVSNDPKESGQDPSPSSDSWGQSAPRGQQNDALVSNSHDVEDTADSIQNHPALPQEHHMLSPETQQFSEQYRPQPTRRESPYQSRLLDAEDYSQTRTPAEGEDLSANWQHLRRRNSNSQQPTPPEQNDYQAPPQQRAHESDPDWVDRQFAAHLEQRQQQQASIYDRSSAQRSPFDSTPSAAEPSRQPPRAIKKCGRCGEVGHIAKECTGPNKPRGKCHLCGQQGHYAKDCSLNERKKSRRGNDVSDMQKGSRSINIERLREEYDSPAQSRNDPFADPESSEVAISAAEEVDPFSSQRPTRRRQDEERSHPREKSSRARRGFADPEVGDEGDALSDVRNRVLRRPSRFENEAEDEGLNDQRQLRSRKFADEGRGKKASRGRRNDRDEEEDDDSGAAREEARARKAEKREREQARKEEKQAQAADRKAKQLEDRHKLNLPEFINVATLAQTLGVRYEKFVRRLERLGYDDIFPGKVLNSEISGLIAMEYDFEPIFESTAPDAEERDLKARPEVEDKSFLPVRPPVVTIMGHVDHGKTTILDYMRKSSVAAGEAGGITQHIGAFTVPLAGSGRTVTFLDTPGHAAFLAMRQRGANVTDIVILVVAGDDSVKPQTLEALKHAKAAGVPMIVAVNKMDKEGADLQRVKQDLARHGVEIEDFGGETQVVPVSGKTGLGMDELEENVVTLSEILDHRAETDGPVEGWVLEATTKKAGRVATVLVRRGTLRQGSIIVAGRTWARVRSLHNEGGQAVQEVGPGMPVEVDGWRDQPMAGDEVLQAPSEQKATDVVEFREEKAERERTAQDMEAINSARRSEQEKREKERLAKQGEEQKEDEAETDQDNAKTLQDLESSSSSDSGHISIPFIIKADVSGSAEAVAAYILSVSSPLISPRILRSAVGPINPSDIELAAAAQGHLISFNLPANEPMKAQANSRGVKVLENNIIYRVLDDVRGVLEVNLPPVINQRVLGEAEISAAFEIGVGGRKKMKIAGCKVRNGTVGKGSRVRILRGSERVYDGTITSLKNVKKDVQEMRKGTECGMGFEEWEAFEVGDQIQTYEEFSEKRRL
ncbi:initiation factor 2 [Hortaea werneckii]|nr:initiation factor 2 [Hortaea werneckii]